MSADEDAERGASGDPDAGKSRSGSPIRYPDLHESGELAKRAETALFSLHECRLCAHVCRVDRHAGQLGTCRTGIHARVANYGPHRGEERPLVGRGGSGTIFFSGCSMSCVYCQNWDISTQPGGDEVGTEQLADMMLDLQNRGCENVNLVSPTHVVPLVLHALDLAAAGGLSIPLVYNTGTYDMLETLELLDGVVDIYLPDAKYADERTAQELSGVSGYPALMRQALTEMHRQVGDLALDERGVATRGILVRHLVLPADLAGTAETMSFIAEHLGTDTYVNVMAQYHPCHEAHAHPEISRRVTALEVAAAVETARAAGLRRLDRFTSDPTPSPRRSV
jgi:putative pyruvate formate lyase activating enzyme